MFAWIGDKLSAANIGEMIAPTQSPEEQLHTAIEQGAMEKVKPPRTGLTTLRMLRARAGGTIMVKVRVKVKVREPTTP